jgi:hypothetical protein
MDTYNIKLTVALPVFNSQKIGWLAMEGLCNQKGINFDWELIIAEEQIDNILGKAFFDSYSDRLKKVGCVKINYLDLGNKWVSLSRKWKIIADNSNKTSEVYVLHAIDCYSRPDRLLDAYEYIANQKYDWVQDKIGVFYNISYDKCILYYDPAVTQSAGLNMATRVDLMKMLPVEDLKSKIDGWIRRNIEIKSTKNLNKIGNGVDTDGLNNISKSREKYFRKQLQQDCVFKPTNLTIEQLIPQYICDKLKSLAK